jgi:hypothetical protein
VSRPRFRIPNRTAPANLLGMVQRSQRARASQAKGARGEDTVAAALVASGYRMVERISTPCKLVTHGGAPRIVYVGRVSGDYRAILTTSQGAGISVLVESKAYDGRLPWSAFEDHQPVGLTEHEDLGGISLVAWVDRGEVRLIAWREFRRVGFCAGKSVEWDSTTESIRIHKPARARAQKVTTR